MPSENTSSVAFVESIVPRVCICPTVTIHAKPGQVSEDQQRQIATSLFAMVEVITDERLHCGRTVFGKHRGDCPCGK